MRHGQRRRKQEARDAGRCRGYKTAGERQSEELFCQMNVSDPLWPHPPDEITAGCLPLIWRGSPVGQ
ncbi:hypothetical protein MPL3365_120113 [Mesorhizobium plurifarium]|uniref:Uncharacterized protein n=1 Tax=Mesorhizobium plurifarium TaxID=69974 RepID=A0A090FV84_MESPL|nr:hypothetical protein MPL3365_120113 [Mesorhizobium plurifarium]